MPSAEDRARFGEDPQASFAANLADVRARIAAACARAGRDPAGVRLLPITKTVPPHILRLAYAAGMGEMGENKIQEAVGKTEALADLPIRWSIVGHLQSNKAKYLARFAVEFHALDSLKLAAELNRRLEAEGRDLDVFVQANTSSEESKFGLEPAEVADFVKRLGEFPRLRPRGLMTLAIFSQDMAKVRECFRILRRLRDETGLEHLSMGMSGDYEAAIEEGATIVRVGQSIFGARPAGSGPYWPGYIPGTG
ncbi:YggS family pyridoxal phosphate-dependent enzyme [Roseococcus sp. YIM B11640]|uniref:YggS family pyridoxal phosphate-dependent enzyme n=1 Tax=Roseococcus sp. YIM B11640 TaxID=3133973 RepID=UPI003C7C98A5